VLPRWIAERTIVEQLGGLVERAMPQEAFAPKGPKGPVAAPARATSTPGEGASLAMRALFLASLVLRVTGPASALLLALHSGGFVCAPRLVRLWAAVEAVFYVGCCALAKRLSRLPEPPPITPYRRRELWQRILANPGSGGSVRDFAAAWFNEDLPRTPPIALVPEALGLGSGQSQPTSASQRHRGHPISYEDLTLDDVNRWLAWGLLGRPFSALGEAERTELGRLVGALEDVAGQRLSRTTFASRASSRRLRPMCPQIDPVRWTARPLALYGVTHAFGALAFTPRTMRASGFGSRRTLELPSVGTLRYFVRPPVSPAADHPPFVFIHGVGVGPAPYASCLAKISEASGAAVIAVEVPAFAQRLSLTRSLTAAPPPLPSDFAKLVTAAVRRTGHERFHLIGHSLGSAYASYTARHAPTATASVSLIDPICLSMHDAQVTRAFMYSPADTIQHEVDNYYFKTELFTSHVVARHLWWYEAARWVEDTRAETPSLVALSMEDEIVPVDAIRTLWGARKARDSGAWLHSMHGISHGGWLADDEALTGLVRAITLAARPVPS
jgi:pimeloyl-ACP methyl ester carboxylesterase